MLNQMARGHRNMQALNHTPSPRQRLTARVAGETITAQIVTDPSLVEPIIERLATLKEIAIDFETTCDQGEYGDDYGPDKGQIRLVQIGYHNPKTNRPEQIIFDGFDVDLGPVKQLIENPRVKKIVHYSSFETAWARHHLGAEFRNLDDTCFAVQSINKELRHRVARQLGTDNVDELQALISNRQDSYLLSNGEKFSQQQVEAAEAAVIIDCQDKLKADGHDDLATIMRDWSSSEKAKLSDLCHLYLGQELPKEEQASDWGERQLSQSQLRYAAADAAITLALGEKIRNLAQSLGVDRRVARRIELERERALAN